jgi:hypothetical protein
LTFGAVVAVATLRILEVNRPINFVLIDELGGQQSTGFYELTLKVKRFVYH